MKVNGIGKIFLIIALSCSASLADTVNIPLAPTIYGSADSDGAYGGVSYDYRIGQTEVSYTQYAASGLGGGNTWVGTAGVNAPVAGITFHQAAQYCNWLTSGSVNAGAYTIAAGKVTAVMSRAAINSDGGLFYVLPTEDEWYKAAYFTGSGYSDYANGLNGMANAPLMNTDARYVNPAPGGTAPNTVWAVDAGAEEQNLTKNMMGNVFEWLQASADGDLNLPGNEDMVFRGGAAQWLGGTGDEADDRLHRGYRATGIFTDNSHDDVGFRVVAIPEPGTISLMSLSTVSLFITRSIRRRKRIGETLMPVRREPLCNTFGTEEEWFNQNQVETDSDYLAMLFETVKIRSTAAWSVVHNAYGSMDRIFWDRMVERHEIRMVKRQEYRQAVKTKIINGFDTFLALIMK
ncbi:MAG: SUMF1/EgtB/PvdO family nonheme iron enzyme [Pontiella sp.]